MRGGYEGICATTGELTECTPQLFVFKTEPLSRRAGMRPAFGNHREFYRGGTEPDRGSRAVLRDEDLFRADERFSRSPRASSAHRHVDDRRSQRAPDAYETILESFRKPPVRVKRDRTPQSLPARDITTRRLQPARRSLVIRRFVSTAGHEHTGSGLRSLSIRPIGGQNFFSLTSGGKCACSRNMGGSIRMRDCRRCSAHSCAGCHSRRAAETTSSISTGSESSVGRTIELACPLSPGLDIKFRHGQELSGMKHSPSGVSPRHFPMRPAVKRRRSNILRGRRGVPARTPGVLRLQPSLISGVRWRVSSR